jgi:hypothetical protein
MEPHQWSRDALVAVAGIKAAASLDGLGRSDAAKLFHEIIQLRDVVIADFSEGIARS